MSGGGHSAAETSRAFPFFEEKLRGKIPAPRALARVMAKTLPHNSLQDETSRETQPISCDRSLANYHIWPNPAIALLRAENPLHRGVPHFHRHCVKAQDASFSLALADLCTRIWPLKSWPASWMIMTNISRIAMSPKARSGLEASNQACVPWNGETVSYGCCTSSSRLAALGPVKGV